MEEQSLMTLKGNIWLANSWKQEIVITDKAVYGEAIIGLSRKKMTLPFDLIAQVNISRGVFSAELEVINKGGAANLTIKGLKKSEAEEAKSLIEKYIKQVSQPDKERHTSEPSQYLADDIRKLNELKTEGILTEEEFQKKKYQLLNIK